MPSNCDIQRLLREAARLHEGRQGDFLEQATAAYQATHTVRTGRRPKADYNVIFRAIVQRGLEVLQKTDRLPTKYALAKYLSAQFSLTQRRARTHVDSYILWRWRGYSRLTSRDHRWLEKYFTSVWKPFKSQSWMRRPVERRKARHKALEQAEAEIRPLELQLLNALSARTAKLRKDDSIKTGAELLKQLKLS